VPLPPLPNEFSRLSVIERKSWTRAFELGHSGGMKNERFFPTLIAFAAVCLATVPAALAAAPEPCKVLPAETWNGIMGSTATATPGDGNCTYAGKAGGGQFRILANSGSSGDAAALAKRMRDHQSHQPKGGHDPRLNVIDSQGSVVFSIALFQDAVNGSTASQLEKLTTAAKRYLAR
jgi:hypothetical protein